MRALKEGSYDMSNKLETIEARSLLLRKELATAIELRKSADAKASQAKGKLVKGKALLADADREVARLEDGQKAFHDHSEKAYTKFALERIETGISRAYEFIDAAPNNDELIAARTWQVACRNAVAQLADAFATVEDSVNRAAYAVGKLTDAVFAITLEALGNEAIAAQKHAWELRDRFEAACGIAGEKAKDLQDRLAPGFDRFHDLNLTRHNPRHDPKREYLLSQARNHEPTLREYVAALARDSNAQLNEGDTQ
jgi:hypothetical protein